MWIGTVTLLHVSILITLSGQSKRTRRVIAIHILRTSFILPKVSKISTVLPSATNYFISSLRRLALPLARIVLCAQYNKSVLIHFPFPYTLTALHALCGTIGASIVLRLQGPDLGGSTLMGGTTQKSSWSFFHKITPDLSLGESIVLLFFSMLYTINIVVSNASLRLVTVPVSHKYLK
jgi:hypothetical protein